MHEFELILPAYNEAKNLPDLIRSAILAARNAGFNSTRFQLLLVNNGSSDESGQVLTELKRGPEGEWFQIVDVPVNQGYGFGVLQGLKRSQAKYVGWSHADLQCDPANAFTALKIVAADPLEKTLVKGERFGRNWKDKLVTRVFETLARFLLGLKVSEINAQPKVFPASLLNEIKSPPTTFAFDLYALYCAAKNGYRITTIPVLFPPRIHGVSKWASNFLSRYRTIKGMIKYIWELRQEEGPL